MSVCTLYIICRSVGLCSNVYPRLESTLAQHCSKLMVCCNAVFYTNAGPTALKLMLCNNIMILTADEFSCEGCFVDWCWQTCLCSFLSHLFLGSVIIAYCKVQHNSSQDEDFSTVVIFELRKPNSLITTEVGILKLACWWLNNSVSMIVLCDVVEL